MMIITANSAATRATTTAPSSSANTQRRRSQLIYIFFFLQKPKLLLSAVWPEPFIPQNATIAQLCHVNFASFSPRTAKRQGWVSNVLAEFRFESALNAFSSGSICLLAGRLRLHLHRDGILFIAVAGDDVVLL